MVAVKKYFRSIDKIMIICGIFAALLYISTDIFAALLWRGYSYLDQTVSELSAIGAPTRQLWIAMSFLFNPLLIAFGIGVWRMADHKFSLRITGILLIVWGILGFVWLLFPMHMRGAIGSSTDTMHLVMAGITIPLMLLFILFGALAQGRWFRLYSTITIFAMVVFGGITGMQASKVAAQLPTPWLGVMERVSVYSPMVWLVILSVILLHNRKSSIQ